MRSLLLFLGVVSLAPTIRANVRPHPLFGDDMLLQRDRPLPVWGKAAPLEEVTVTLVVRPALGKMQSFQRTTKADDNGHWRVEFAPKAAAPDGELLIQGRNRIRIENVAIGDVWLCAGQSNMEMRVRQLRRDGQRERVAPTANHANLRLFVVPNLPRRVPQRSLKPSLREGFWSTCTPQSVLWFSAAGYFFGRDLLQRDEDVPIGLISADCGGSPCEAWMSRAALAEAGMQHYLDLIAAWGAGRPKVPFEGPFHQMPTALFNGMIAPILPFPIRGVVWYQGEGNADRAKEHRRLLPALISDWRELWKDELPFMVVQVAPYAGDDADGVSGAELRDAQFHASTMLPKVGLVVTTDLGEESDVHPERKEPVGVRLALAARAIAYGDDVEYSGPVFDELVMEGDRALLSFDHVGSGLMCRGQQLTGFRVCGQDRTFYPARAEIRGEQVIVTCGAVPEPVAVRFGWTNFPRPELNFYNGAGLPAVPFRTDDFPLTTD